MSLCCRCWSMYQTMNGRFDGNSELNDMARKFETAIIVIPHDEKIIPTFKQIYHIRDGVTYEEAGHEREFL